MSLDSLYESRLLQEQIRLKNQLIEVLNLSIKDLSDYLAHYAKKFPEDYEKRISYINRMNIKAEIQAQLKQLIKEASTLTTDSVENSWNLSVHKNNVIAKEFIAGITVPVPLAKALFGNNQEALISYLENRSKISDRVLNYVGLYQEQIEAYMSSGIIQGKAAREIANDLMKIANDPMAEFKIMNNLFPEAELAMPKPGQGIYQSVWKNLYRIARTETNISYRLSNYEKRQDMPMVMGVEIHLSDAHEIMDICDAMEGSYPVEFVFCGWHPNCWCYEITVLATREEFKQWLSDGMPKDGIRSQNKVSRIPLSAERYVMTHQQSFEKAYFYRDNFTNGKPLEIIGGARKDLQPYELIPKESGKQQLERIVRASFFGK